jgi:hypothetical protein
MFTSFLEVREATKVNYIAGLSSEFVDSICDEGQQGLRGPSRRFQLRKGAGSANAGLNGIVYAQKYKSDYARE